MRLNFGKYKGKSTTEIDDLAYLGWLYFEASIDPLLKECVLDAAKKLSGVTSIKALKAVWESDQRDYDEDGLSIYDFFEIN